MLIRLPLQRVYTPCHRLGTLLATASAQPVSPWLNGDVEVLSSGKTRRFPIAAAESVMSIVGTSTGGMDIVRTAGEDSVLVLNFLTGCLVSISTSLLEPSPFFLSFYQESLVLFSRIEDFSNYTKQELSFNPDFIQVYSMDFDALCALTPYKGVYTLPIGQNLIVQETGCVLQSAPIRLNDAHTPQSHFDELASKILNRLKRCPQDSAILLSGGLDSSLLALISRSDQQTRHMPLVHFHSGQATAETELHHAQELARECARELVLVDQSLNAALALEAHTREQWPSREAVFHSRLAVASLATGCSNFVDGFGGNEIFMQNPDMLTLLKSGARSMQKLTHLLARSDERMFFSIYRFLLWRLKGGFTGNTRVVRHVRKLESDWGRKTSAVFQRSIVREISRVSENFHHRERSSAFWYPVLQGAATEKRRLMSGAVHLYSPLRHWSVIAASLGVSTEKLIYPESRNFERQLIRHLSSAGVADRYGKVEYKSHALQLLNRHIDQMQVLINSTLGAMTPLDESVLQKKIDQRFYSGHQTLIDMYSLSSFYQTWQRDLGSGNDNNLSRSPI